MLSLHESNRIETDSIVHSKPNKKGVSNEEIDSTNQEGVDDSDRDRKAPL